MTPTPRDLEKAREWLFKHWPVLSPDGTPESIPIYRAITLAQLLADARAEGDRWKQLQELCGYVQDGSQTTVKLWQDDATRTYHVTIGKVSYCGNSFSEALDKAIRARGDQ